MVRDPNLVNKSSSGKAAATNELVPTSVEHILSKSPSLARKLKSEEVIALHSPDSPDRPFQKSPVNEHGTSKSPSRSSTKTSPKALKSVKVIKSNDSSPSSKKRVLEKASSVPMLNTELSLTPDTEVAKSILQSEKTERDETPSSVSIYEEEGISFSVGTVKQQLQAKFESLGAIKNDTTTCPQLDTADFTTQRTMKDQTNTAAVATFDNPGCSKNKQPENQDQEPEAALKQTTTQSDDVSTTSNVCVKTITDKIEGAGAGKQPLLEKKQRKKSDRRILIIDKDGRKASVSRARSLGSHLDLQSKQSPLSPSSSDKVGRASSFKDTINNNLSEKDSSKTSGPQMVKSEIASHKPMPKKEVVIIPKVVPPSKTDKQIKQKHGRKHQESDISGTKHKDTKSKNTKEITNSASRVDETNVQQKRSCDTQSAAQIDQSKSPMGAPVDDSSDIDGSSEDISVKDLCDIFEGKDKGVTKSSADTSPSHSVKTDSSHSESINQSASKGTIPKSSSKAATLDTKEAKSKGTHVVSKPETFIIVKSKEMQAQSNNANTGPNEDGSQNTANLHSESSTLSTTTQTTGETPFETVVIPRKTRKLHGKSHPLSRLASSETPNRGKLYSTM